MKESRVHLALAVGLGLGYLLRTSFAAAARAPQMTVSKTPRTTAGRDGIGTLPPRAVVTVHRPPAKQEQNKSGRPPRCNVELINDDYTSMDFVVEMLRKHFNRTADDAQRIMMKVHTNGSAIANASPLQIDVAETKQVAVMDEAKKREMPFRAEIVRL